MEKEGRSKKVSSSREMGLSRNGFPLDLNLLHLQNSKNNEQIDHPRAAFSRSSPISQRDKPKNSKQSNKEAVKLGYSKSCRVPTLLDESRISKENAKRSFSAPDTLAVPTYGFERFSFEKPVNEHSNTVYAHKNTEGFDVIDDNLQLAFKLPAIRIHSTHSTKQGLQRKDKTAESTAGRAFRLPYVKNKKFYRY